MCITPINLKKETWKQKLQNTYHMQQVPCGRCIECMKSRVKAWQLRLLTELKRCDTAYFVTLTYSDDTLPFSSNGLVSLNYRDHQLFMKRLRKRHDGKPLKFFCAQEYGEKTERPHYHTIIFNASASDIELEWKCGNVHIGEVTPASIAYTLKYALKRATKWKKKVDPDDDREKELARMSRGLGDNYLTDDMKKFHKENLKEGGKYLDTTIALPRYYRDKIFTESEKLARNRLVVDEEKYFDKRASPYFPQRVEKAYSDEEKKAQKTD